VLQGQYLGFDGNTWRHQFITADQIIGLGDQEFTSVIDQMADVDTTTIAPIGGDALVWNGINNWVPLAIAGVGASSNTFVVADITARDALSPADGDSAFVRIGSSGEYEQYVYDSGWILLATADSARSDANTIEYTVNHDDLSEFTVIGNVSQGSRVKSVSIEVTTPFTPSPGDADNTRIRIGTAAEPDLLFDSDTDADLTFVNGPTTHIYVNDVNAIFTDAIDTDIRITYDRGGVTTAGRARAIVTHV
jgi:hypothetical protein